MYKIYEVNGGYGFTVENELTNFAQEHNPYKAGRVPMTQEEAQYFADCIDKGIPIEYEMEELTPHPAPIIPSDRVAKLEDEAAMLALELVDTQIRLDQSETDHASLLFELVDKGVL
ncbi:hypothetical protein PAT3040_06128 [Paenibacillus agaridevorans]|uniref:Uncharacterized protein n=1 Tax=Paenibacillus agaridevorans TaxID=171404 RepID=A0A2R5EXP6_9BACL|nr:hypothetical protein [Paenibacillus agaridevorans]GBG11327.1 hypothetical protein PAT3040_06128 [Paenibacillus agaridevorans]